LVWQRGISIKKGDASPDDNPAGDVHP
jgi:hypothetical protein